VIFTLIKFVDPDTPSIFPATTTTTSPCLMRPLSFAHSIAIATLLSLLSIPGIYIGIMDLPMTQLLATLGSVVTQRIGAWVLYLDNVNADFPDDVREIIRVPFKSQHVFTAEDAIESVIVENLLHSPCSVWKFS